MLKAMSGANEAELWVATRNRLARFGIGIIELYAQQAGARIRECFPDAHDESAESELVCDMLAVVTSFSGQLYGQRSAKAKRLARALREQVGSAE